MGPTSNGDGSDEVSDRARQGVEHLQAAARELIAAARAALDIAEDVVNDPDSLAALAALLGSVGDMARRFAGTGVPGTAPAGADAGPGGADADDGAAPEPPPARVQRITVR